MPSPIGHALAGIAAGWALQPVPVPAGRTAVLRRLCLFAAAGAAPDLDLLVGAHSGPTHGVGAAVIVGVAAFLLVRPRAGARRSPFGARRSPFGEAQGDPEPVEGSAFGAPLALAIAAAYATHILLDWLGTDTSPPIGIMALWPFSHAYYESSAHVFMAISRRYWLPEFWTSNLLALGRELLILLPIVALVMRVRRRA